MKILLLNPINRSYVMIPSLGLGYLAAILSNKGHEVHVLNCMKEKMSFKDFEVYIRNEHFDLIGFQVFSYDLNSVKKCLSAIKCCSPNTITVAGGPHPSGDPSGTLEFFTDLDFAFHGEAEIGFPMFVEDITRDENNLKNIPGLVWKCAGKIHVNSQQMVLDLDTIPMPAWELLKPETYPEAPHGAFAKGFPTAPIITSRGCPSKCTFCAGPCINGRKFRQRSIDSVIDELHVLKERGIKEFHIEDENFTLSSKYVMEFCKRLETEGLEMSWSLPSGVRLDTMSREMAIAMATAGCYSLAVGIEFGTNRILSKTHKGISIKTIQNKMNYFIGTGIKVTGFFMFAIPGETIEEMQKTSSFSRSLPIDRAQFNIFMPLPGSYEWQRLAREGRLENLNWDRLFVHDVSYFDETLSARKIKNVQRSAVLRFYLRFHIMYALVREIRSFRHLKYLLKRLIDTIVK